MLLFIGVAISSFAVLANDVFLDIQELGSLDGIATFNSFDCLCEQDPNDVLPGEEPTFSMDNCDLNPASPGYIGDAAKAICELDPAALNLASLETSESETSESEIRGTSGNLNSEYSSALSANYWEGEGCTSEFWKENRNSELNYA